MRVREVGSEGEGSGGKGEGSGGWGPPVHPHISSSSGKMSEKNVCQMGVIKPTQEFSVKFVDRS